MSIDKLTDHFFFYANEREHIRYRRMAESGKLPAPWTNDWTLQQYRFCNIFREDDKTTVWFRENIRGPMRDDFRVVFATVAFRWFNRIETAELMLKQDLFKEWNKAKCRRTLKGVAPLVTGAYMIKTLPGVDKLMGVTELIQNVYKDRANLVWDLSECNTLEEAHQRIMVYPYLGSFMAYELVTDLRHTVFLDGAEDIMTWASAGPGAARGLGRIFHDDVGHYNYNSRKHQEDMMAEMRYLLHLSKDSRYWPKNYKKWEMREVEHTLCEFDKWMRAKSGDGRPKQLFNGKGPE